MAKGFRVVGKEGPFIAPFAAFTSNCLWNSAILQQEVVIDAQHGASSAMLGGFVVESGSVVLDGSLDGQLEQMRRRLVSG